MTPPMDRGRNGHDPSGPFLPLSAFKKRFRDISRRRQAPLRERLLRYRPKLRHRPRLKFMARSPAVGSFSWAAPTEPCVRAKSNKRLGWKKRPRDFMVDGNGVSYVQHHHDGVFRRGKEIERLAARQAQKIVGISVENSAAVSPQDR